MTTNKLPEWRKALNKSVENYQSAQAWYEENQDSPSAEQDVDTAAGEIEKLLKQYGVLIVLSLLDEIAELQEHRTAVEDKDLLGVIDALEHPAGINAAGKQVVRRALVELQEIRRSYLALRGEIEDVQSQLYEADNQANEYAAELQERRKADSQAQATLNRLAVILHGSEVDLNLLTVTAQSLMDRCKAGNSPVTTE
nr:hypothetical protein [Citrobacter freundii]